ncbi:thioredoxin [Penaeicola halotolerans]|uniref:thioredoxin n=1 Tax=Penaeicola halotolerans TaxID=2793196 RepID=UPI001CF8C578|nr:thioredoxin [Penaeicola halotolerans]
MAKKSFKDQIAAEPMPVLVDFYADWCKPCKSMSPIIQQVVQELGGQVKLIKVNVDKTPHAVQAYSITSVPTFILFKKGKQLWRKTGTLTKDSILNQLKGFNF